MVDCLKMGENGRRQDISQRRDGVEAAERLSSLWFLEINTKRTKEEFGGLDCHEFGHLGFEQAGKDLITIWE
jgi:hypothetical protein